MDHRTEDEQIENIKDWFRQYGNKLMYAVLAILGVVYGYKWFNNRQQVFAENASGLYTKAIDAFIYNKDDEFSAISSQMLKDYKTTIYADFTRLLLARKAMKAKDNLKTQKYLEEVITNSTQDAIKNIAKYRLARLYVSMSKNTEALALLEQFVGTNFEMLSNELKGDIYLKNKKYDESKKSYELALTSIKGKQPSLESMLNYKLQLIPKKN